MKVHEYQARQILLDAGVPVPPAVVCSSGLEAGEAFEKLRAAGASGCVVKAQVHAGGRGKGGGVKLVGSACESAEAAGTILGRPLVTKQTGPAGVTVRRVLVSAAVDIAREFYLAVTLDRASARPILIASAQGGVEIEEVAARDPKAIIRQPIHPLAGLASFQARRVAAGLGLRGPLASQAVAIMMKISGLLTRLDAEMIEINPLVLTKPSPAHPEGQLVAIDAKMGFDDNALFRHPDLLAMADGAEEPEAEKRAKARGLNYIKLDGTIGCLVNGAGLAMATMDIIKLHGGSPANFLDVGGSADDEAVSEAFSILLSDPCVRGVLVNIFGGIMPCDRVARAIVAAGQKTGFRVPLVVRLEGTNVEAARAILDEAKGEIPQLITARDLAEAATLVVAR